MLDWLGPEGDVIATAFDRVSDPTLLPSSCLWGEAMERRASEEIRVAYAGGVTKIPKGGRFFVDSFERVLVGWHGTYDPPGGMDAGSMI